MKYKVIDNQRLNVYLTKKDLLKEKVTIEDIVGGSAYSIIRIKKIFKVVSKLAHFNINNQSLNIVLMPIADGDLIISAGISEERESAFKQAVFEFENFENVLEMCHLIKWYNILTSLYMLDGKYYILIEMKEYSKNQFDYICAIVNEYGNKLNFSTFYVKEHGKIIIKNHAAELLNEKFS